MNEIEKRIVDNARSYRGSQRPAYESPSGRYTTWFQRIHKHYEESVLAEILAAPERLVDYWPCYVILEGREDKHDFENTTQVEYHGKYGSGYICVTNAQVRLFILDQLTAKYPPLEHWMKSLARKLALGLLAMGTPFYDFVALRGDKVWTIPHRSIVHAEIRSRYDTQTLNLETKYGNFELLGVFEDHLPVILTVLNMAIGGELAKMRVRSVTETKPPSERSTELLAKLEELRAAGVITQSEFDEKARLLGE